MPYSSSIMFLPISPSPPRGTSFRFGLAILIDLEHIQLLRLRCRFTNRLGFSQKLRDFPHIGFYGLLKTLLVQGGGGVIHGVVNDIILLLSRAVNLTYRFTGEIPAIE